MAVTISNAIKGGLAGASVLSIIQQVFQKLDKSAPKVDSLGINTAARLVGNITGAASNAEHKLVKLPVGGQILSNALYFSLAGFGAKKNVLMRSALLGLTAGLGTLVLPQHLGLTEQINQPVQSKVKTIAGYLIGSMIAAAAIRILHKNAKKIKEAA